MLIQSSVKNKVKAFLNTREKDKLMKYIFYINIRHARTK